MKRVFKALTPMPARRGRQPLQTVAASPGQPVDRARLEQAARQKRAEQALRDGGKTKEIGGPEGPEPTRYGDWERGGICYDF